MTENQIFQNLFRGLVRVKNFLQKNFLLFMLLFIVWYYCVASVKYSSPKQNIFIFRDNRTFEIYLENHKNAKCHPLNETLWNIYKELTMPEVFVLPEERSNLSLKDLGLVTFTSKNHMKEALINCASLQNHPQLKSLSFTIFFSSDVTDDQRMQYRNACSHANIIQFPFEKFPDRVKFLDNYIFKPLYQAMSLRNHKVLLSFDTSVLFNEKSDFKDFVQSNVKANPTDVTLLSSTRHNMFSTTHPKMFDCFPNIDPEKMINVEQYQATVILWIGSEAGWEAMGQFVECGFKPGCMAPEGSTKSCDMKEIYKNPKKFSGCHRFDQAAINYILYENSKHQPKLYQRKTKLLRIAKTNVEKELTELF